MRVSINRLLTISLLAIPLVLCTLISPAAALDDSQLAEINAAVATCDSAKVEAAIQKAVQAAIAAGQEPGEAAQQALQAATATGAASCPNMDAITQAATNGAVAGAVAAAEAAGEDADAYRLAALDGANRGSMPEEAEAFEPPRGAPAAGAPPTPELPPTQDMQPASPT